MDKAKEKIRARKKRQDRVRRQVKGSNERPRLCVFRSLRYTYAQVISDESGSVLTAASSKGICPEGVSPASVEGAKLLGQKIAELVKEKSVKQVVFDRNGYLYHGRIAAVAAGAREAGLKL
jgi:large subunit ribosomal protein L18